MQPIPRRDFLSLSLAASASLACGGGSDPAPANVHQQLLDLVFTVGAYDTVAMVFRAFDVELDADLKRK